MFFILTTLDKLRKASQVNKFLLYSAVFLLFKKLLSAPTGALDISVFIVKSDLIFQEQFRLYFVSLPLMLSFDWLKPILKLKKKSNPTPPTGE